MTEGRWKNPPYRIFAAAAVVTSLLSYGMYRSFVDHAIVGPTSAAAEHTVNALGPNGETTEPSPELPVWPPPSATTPVDPAANPMSGALPTRIDWPDASSHIAKPR